ncbi:LysR substrate-binding domain-containing protein [Falsirhodobacter sp. 1013]|uniref:LysR substrate-binding domain-containing protein n=1 Tax=Falsirhodobacter sp. 1013 TaxID=3417566 RepID=UPI003EB84318
MDIRRLKSFITIVDMGSITRAADMLHIAQPALSQHLAFLEGHFKQKLLIRSQQGVVLTEAGRVVYRHAQIMLRQMDQAQADALTAGETLTGRVSVGLAPFSAAASLSIDLFRIVRERHPGILLHIVESTGQAYSQLIMNGRLEVALLHGSNPIKGVKLQSLGAERFVLVHKRGTFDLGADPLPVARLSGVPMLLPPSYNFVRRAIDISFGRTRADLNVIGEFESVKTLSRAVGLGMGATIMPRAIAHRIEGENDGIAVTEVHSPAMEETLAICVSDQMPLSEPACVVRDLLLELTAQLDL